MDKQSLSSIRKQLYENIMQMNDAQCGIALEAFKISNEDGTMTPEECCILACERLGIPIKRKRGATV